MIATNQPAPLLNLFMMILFVNYSNTAKHEIFFLEVCKFDFEDGIGGWEKTGTAFNNQPTYGDNPTARGYSSPANQQGDWWIGGFENRPLKKLRPDVLKGTTPEELLLPHSLPSLAKTSRS